MEGLERLRMPCLGQGALGHLHTQGGLECTPENLRDIGIASQLHLTGQIHSILSELQCLHLYSGI